VGGSFRSGPENGGKLWKWTEKWGQDFETDKQKKNEYKSNFATKHTLLPPIFATMITITAFSKFVPKKDGAKTKNPPPLFSAYF
jgi:hypothetical protein